jgi:hypothetical protein
MDHPDVDGRVDDHRREEDGAIDVDAQVRN